MTKYAVLFLKDKLTTENDVHDFERSLMAPSPLLESIHAPRLKEALHKKCTNVARQARSRMMTMYIKCAEEQKRQCQLDYAAATRNMLDTKQNLTPHMCELIQKRLANVSEHLEYEYQFHTAYVRLKTHSR